MFESLEAARRALSEKELRAVHSRMEEAVQDFKYQEARVIRTLQEVDCAFVYRFLGFCSLYTYAVEALKLSESQAYTFVSVARKARELPALQKAIETGEITVNKARRLASVIDERNQTEWIQCAKESTHRELEKIVATANPRAAVPESARYVNDSVLDFRAPMSESTYQLVQRVKELLVERSGDAVTMDKVIELVCNDFLDRNDPVRKAERAERRKEKREAQESVDISGTCQRNPQSGEPSRIKKELKRSIQQGKRKPIPASVRHRVAKRDNGQCTEPDARGVRCKSKIFLDFHHVTPVSRGGLNTVENLRLVCFHHHKMIHEREEGAHLVH